MARRKENGFWSGVEKAATTATKVGKWARSRTYKVTAADLERAPRKQWKVRAESEEEAIKIAKRQHGEERFVRWKVKNPMPRTNPEAIEGQLRAAIKQGVSVFGIAGVLNLLADEANDRLDVEGDEAAQEILDAIETAIEEIEEIAEQGSEEDDDSEEDEEEDDADDEEEDDEEE